MTSDVFLKKLQFVGEYVVEHKKPTGLVRNPQILANFLSTFVNSTDAMLLDLGVGWDCAFKLFMENIHVGLVRWNHPLFFGFFPAGCSYESLLSDVLISGVNNNGFSWTASPANVETELCVLQWLGVKLGIPDKMLPYIRGGDGRPNRVGGSTILSSASECVFMATTMAIEHRKKLKSSASAREVLVVYCATTAHSCVLKACLILGVKLVKIGVDKNMAISLDDLTFATEASIASGLTPCMVVATFGSTSCGSIDNISEVAKIAKRFKLYMHIDGAYGGSALLIRKFRAKCVLNNVDSINLNPNKCLQVTLDCGCMWYSNRELLNHLHDKSALYVEYDGIVDGLEVPSNDCGISLSRPFRSLKLFFVLMSIGVVELRRLMVQQIRETNLIVSHLQRYYGNIVEILRVSGLPIFCFRIVRTCRGDDIDKDWDVSKKNRATLTLLVALNNTGMVAITPTYIAGGLEIFIRISVNNPIGKKSLKIFFALLKKHIFIDEGFCEKVDCESPPI